MGKNKQPKKQKLSEESIANVLKPLSDEQIDSLSAKDLRILLKGEQKIRLFLEESYQNLQAIKKELEDKVLCIEGQIVKLKNRIFSPKSERRGPINPKEPKEPSEKKKPLNKNRDLRKRYPEAEVIEREVKLETLPTCQCCQEQMSEMGVFEQSQHVTVIPKKYLITNILRMKYHCTHCHGHIQTAPVLPRIAPRSSYGDKFLTDAALSKYCDLLPIERYCKMAARGGFEGLPPSSIHEGIWRFAQFLLPVYELTRIETLDSRILSGDETKHKMLEGHEKNDWYLWGFFGTQSCFFEYHPTRAGVIAGDVLSESGCKYFLSDAYSGYSKAIKDANELRIIAGLELIIEVFCNAHARRMYEDCGENEDAKNFIAWYQEIYQLEKQVKLLLPDKVEEATKVREQMTPTFTSMKVEAEKKINCYPTGHNYYNACQYFLNQYEGLTVCLKDPYVPLDNNHSERGLRPHVVGRKTWYGTHSERSAEAAAIHFTIVESCKMIGVNPREYYQAIVEAIHFKMPLFTPSQFKVRPLAPE